MDKIAINNKNVKITKVEDKYEGLHPNGINPGYTKTGYATGDVIVGSCAFIGTLRTSTVQEIIDQNTFRTKSGKYAIEIIND